MPIKTSLDLDLGIAIQRVTAEFRGDEVVEAQRRLFADPDHDPTTPVLCDAREAVLTQLDLPEIHDMVAKSESLYDFMATGRTAILVGSRADFGMGRMYQSLVAAMPRELRVFEDYDEAVTWLTAPEDGSV